MLRFTTRALQTVFRSTQPLRRLPAMAMTTQKPPISPLEDTVNKLGKHLDEEITYEKENGPKISESQNFIAKQGWTISNSGTLIDLKKQTGDVTVHVVFSARSPAPEEAAEQGKKEEDNSPADDFHEFTAYVQRAGRPNTIFADYLTSAGERHIMTLGFTNDYAKHSKYTKLERPASVYGGPDLNSLDAIVVQGVQEYMTSLGVNAQLSSFVETYSIDAEHPFYVKWLEDIKTFIK